MSLLNGSYLDSQMREPRQPVQVFPLGPLSLVTAPTAGVRVVTVDQAKKFARADLDDHSEDDQFEDMIDDATEYCQKMIPGWRQFLPATYSAPLACWWGRAIKLPRPPLIAVDFIKYLDLGGVLQTLATSYYQVRTYQCQPGEIDRAPIENWPSAAWPLTQLRQLWPITVQFQAGYTTGTLPGTIRRAILFLVAQWYTKRAPCGTVPDEMANTMSDCLALDGWGSYSGYP